MKNLNIKTICLSLVAIVLIIIVVCELIPSKSETPNEKSSGDASAIVQPLNVSIYLDLSNRLIHNTDNISQVEKDTTIVSNFVNRFITKAVSEKIVNCKDKMDVFFYPTPNDKGIVDLSNSLEIDMPSIANPAQKKHALLDMQSGKWRSALEKIYSTTISTNNWVGSDIWGFFDNTVDVQCIKKDYRNVLVILTDGYIYHKDNVLDKGSAHSYISPTTLKDANSSLIVDRKDLKNLEVLVLEVNPCPQTDYTHMKQVLSEWFKGMGISHYEIYKTDQPKLTKNVIDQFMSD